jgi:CheY-like chemotaxis protein
MNTVLLIEDHTEIRENTTELLELEGYKVFSARNGAEGIAVAKSKLPDLILCDVMMPEKNGWEVIKELKSTPETASIPFVFITASVEKKEMQAGIDMGAVGYIRKPFEHEDLINAIKEGLKKK